MANKKRLPKPSLEIIKKKWKNFFTNRLKELEEEENLQTRIDLRNQMDLPIDSVDIEKLKSIEVKAKTLMEENSSSKPKEIQSSSSAQTRKRLFKVEKVETYELKPIKSEPGTLKSPESSKKPKLKPIVDLEELSTELSSKVEAFSGGRKSFNNSKADSGLASNDDSLPSPSESLASTPNVYNLGTNLFQNSDIITLFGAYSMLSTEMQSHLTEIMNEIEKTDPERYVFLTNSQIDDSEGFEDEDNLEAAKLVAAEITDPPLKSQAVELESDDDDDYQLEDSVLLKRVLENSKTVEILDDSDGDEPVELVDLTAY